MNYKYLSGDLLNANKELAFQKVEKGKRAAELIVANKELAFQNEEKDKRAAELFIANKELIFQNGEKEKRAAELIVANKELAFQNEEKDKRAAELFIANKELIFQNQEKEKRAAELIIAKEKAEESDRLKSAFLANMNHEIRTPMNGIMGFAELLKEPNLSNKNRQKYIGVIEECGVRMLETIDNIINISKIESGQMDISISRTDINVLIKNIYTLFKPEAAQKGLVIQYENTLLGKDAIINADGSKIYIILTYLLRNAIKFTAKGSIRFGYELKPCLEPVDKKVRELVNKTVSEPAELAVNELVELAVSEPVELEFFVKDTGIGIQARQMEFIFNSFRQGSESSTKKYEGAGLGLSISKSIVSLLGGKIWIKSESGKGSTVYFTVPYAPYPDENPAH
jgi:signal transduction histidine kinase